MKYTEYKLAFEQAVSKEKPLERRAAVNQLLTRIRIDLDSIEKVSGGLRELTRQEMDLFDALLKKVPKVAPGESIEAFIKRSSKSYKDQMEQDLPHLYPELHKDYMDAKITCSDASNMIHLFGELLEFSITGKMREVGDIKKDLGL